MALRTEDPFSASPPLSHEKLRIAVTARRIAYLKLGYEPIPVLSGRKRPAINSWQDVRITIPPDEDVITPWAETYPSALSTGIRTRYTPGFDIDIRDQDVADQVEQALLNMIPQQGTVLKRVGLPPKRLIPFRCVTPFKKISATFKSPDDVVHKVEVLCDGQQFVAEGIHETTQQPYRWADNVSLVNVAHEHLPLIDEPLARSLVAEASEVMRRAGWSEVGAKFNGKNNNGKSNGKAGVEAKETEPRGSTIYGRTALRAECDKLAALPENSGRNNALNSASFSLFQLVAGGELDEEKDRVRECLFAAAEACGLVAEDGAASVHATIESGAKAGRLQPRQAGNGANKEDQRADLPPPPRTLADVHATFRKWLGDGYDIDAVDAVVATAAAEKLDGDPLWLLVVSGPGAAKTETVQSLAGCGARITSTIQSEGALLSASKSRSKNATGGLLRKMGDRGILVIKDVTSILSSDRNVRASVLAAIREIYDGRWERNVGSDGGQTLTWSGRIAIVGAVTTAWDTAHAVVAAMGDRFVLIRIDSSVGRKTSGRQAIRNTGDETKMREELAAVVGGVVYHTRLDVPPIREDNEPLTSILNAADIVTMGRTAVERDYQGEIINSHAAEMPTRFAKQLTQMVRGGVAVGMSPERALQLALRCARDSIRPLRLDILVDVAKNPHTRPGDVRERINKPWRTTKREMEALHMLGLLTCKEERTGYGQEEKTVWRYTLASGFDRDTLLAMVAGDGAIARNVSTGCVGGI
jgi:Bifunctional DNA primase/polymerase, N-terminal